MTKRERTRIVKELYAAAEKIETQIFFSCCGAISCLKSKTVFIDLFAKDAWRIKKHKHPFWFRSLGESPEDACPSRVLGLLWCAHMVETGFFG